MKWASIKAKPQYMLGPVFMLFSIVINKALIIAFRKKYAS